MTERPATLVVMALEIEAQEVFERAGVPVLYTGLGKVNAALSLMRALRDYRDGGQALPLVLNFGTAGSHSLAAGTLVACHSFVQRDMDVSGLGFALGVTPFEDIPAQLDFPAVFAQLPTALCGSGDSFQMGVAKLHCEVIDMEAYALAKVCRLEGAPFGCAKYVTDGADGAAPGDWQRNLPRAAAAFWQLYRLHARL
ncbi:MAG TPA: 5'-nucleosidase [Steroidobacteraceae bacterium]|jgi:adenosylhomocysteine nucleosidase